MPGISPPNLDRVPIQRQRGQGIPDDVLRHSDIQQRSHRHVPGDTTHEIQMENQARLRLIEEAHIAAPNPLSMFTTDSPGAQLLSMVSRAEMPPVPVP